MEYIYDEQPVGFINSWPRSSFSFVTIHGAGHEVPAYMPEVAFDMWEKFLTGYWTCNNSTSNVCQEGAA